MDKVPTPASTHVGTQASLEPLDRLSLANKSRNIGRKVIEAARSSRSVDYRVKFISELNVRQLVDRDAVILELKRSRKGPLTTQEPWKLCKILTILYIMGRPTKLRLFVSKSVNDMHLPFSGVRDSDNTTALRSTKDPHAPLIMLDDRADTENFLRHQWAVLAHVFRPQQDEPIPHYTIEDEVILPSRGQNLTARQGASGKVFWTSIDPDHHHWDWNKGKDGINSNAFAIKTLHSEGQLNFNREVGSLRSLSKECYHHPHIVPLLASYEQKSTFNLIFPWADMDLFAYWEDHVHPVQDARTARWVAEQCRGLAEALSRIHTWQTFSDSYIICEEEQEGNRYTKNTKNLRERDEKAVDSIPKSSLGMHGRVKPENILWYPGSSTGDLGILKITYFGMATLSRDYSRPGTMPVSPTYRSPEYDLYATQSPACDVWALGCTCLEFVTWFYGGRQKLHDSAMARL